jgi:hypothetical protein
MQMLMRLRCAKRRSPLTMGESLSRFIGRPGVGATETKS